MSIGIYCIENTINNKKCIGKSVKIGKRLYKHKSYLKSGIHPNNHLQSSWNKYGEENFTFFIIEECSREDLSEKEIYYISLFDTKNIGYNKTDGGEGVLGIKFTDERLKKMSEASKGKIPSKETREKISNALKGRIISDETREKLSKVGMGHSVSEETRKKLSEIGKKPKNWVKRKVKPKEDNKC
jgi:group I intron endonuclease